jgi:hypothetical protein
MINVLVPSVISIELQQFSAKAGVLRMDRILSG